MKKINNINIAGEMLNDSLSGYAAHAKQFCYECNKIKIGDKRLKVGKNCEECKGQELMNDRGDDLGNHERG